MIAALSCISTQGLWILADPQASSVLAAESWEETESSKVSQQIGPALDRVLASAGVQRDSITRLLCVRGPGSFTGLRVSASFAMGLARALGLRTEGIATFDLVGQPFCFPLQLQKYRDLDEAAAASQGIDCLSIESASTERIVTFSGQAPLYGIGPRRQWPTPGDLLRAVQNQPLPGTAFSIVYGLEPKISGVRGSGEK